MFIVRLLLSSYRQQTMQVKWGTNFSSPFTVTNGVRQGGVLSPYLFAVYLDELSEQLGSARVGCTVGNMVVNHLMFADDNVCSPPVLVDSNVFWIFVVIMLLNTKSTLIVTKRLVFLFVQKSINNLLHLIVVIGVRVQFFDQMKYLGVLLNASLKDDHSSRYCAANNLQSTFDQCSPAGKILYFMPIACQSMLANCWANTHRLVWSGCALHTILPTKLCITYQKM